MSTAEGPTETIRLNYYKQTQLLGQYAVINANSFVNVSYQTDNSRFNRYSGKVDQEIRY